MSVPNRIVSISAKIERAEEHIRDLKLEIEVFRKTEPYRVVGYDDLDAGERVVKLQVVAQPPPRLLAILGDAIHCLRSSLDYLVWQLVEANGGTPTDRTAFPISDTIEQFESGYLGKLEGCSTDAIDLIQKLRPYKKGNYLLWGLHRLDIVDKHRLLITTAGRTTGILVRGVVRVESFFTNDLFTRNLPPRGAVRDGTVLFAVNFSKMTPAYKDPDFIFDVAFGEIFEGQLLTAQLFELVAFVKRTLEPFRPLLNR